MNDKRRHKRFTVEAMDIRNNVTLFRRVTIIDIGVYGLAFEVDKKLETGMHYTLNLRGKEKTVFLKGMVTRSSIRKQGISPRGTKRPIYTIGFKFVDMTSHQINELIDFINDYTQKNFSLRRLNRLNGLRFSARVPIHNPGKDVLNFVEDYCVKDLSLGGMLIEGNEKVEPDTRLPMEIIPPKNRPIKVIGKIVRCSLVEHVDTNLFQIGVEFIDVSAEDTKRIEELVKAVGEIEDLISQ